MLAEDHSLEAVLAALRFGVDYTFTIQVRQLKVTVRVLSIVERVAIANDVTAEMAKKPVGEQNGLTEATLLTIRTLERATTDSPEDTREPRMPAAILTKFSADELQALYRAYSDACDKLDPSMETLSVEKIEEMIAAAKKNPSAMIEWPRPHLEIAFRRLLSNADAPGDNTSGGSSTSVPTAAMP